MFATGVTMALLYAMWTALAPFRVRHVVRAVWILVAGILIGAGYGQA